MSFDVFAHCNLRQLVFRQRERRWATRRSVWLGAACLGIVIAAPVSAQQPMLRDTFGQGDQGWISSLAFSPDGKTLASAGEESITLWDVSSGKAVRQFKHSSVVLSVAFSPDGKTLASGGSAATGEDAVPTLWNAASGKAVRQFEGHSAQITSVAFSPDGKTLASGSLDWNVRIWDVATGQNTATFQGTSPILSLAFHPKGTMLAYGSTAANFDLFDLGGGKHTATLNERTTAGARNAHRAGRLYVAFSPDGKTLASGSEDKTVRLWDVASGKVVAVLEGHAAAVTSDGFSPDGKTLASGSEDKTIRLWDVGTGKTIAILKGHTEGVSSVAFSPDGKTLASGSSDQMIKLWDLSSTK